MQLIERKINMKKIYLFISLAFMMSSSSLFAQRSTDIEGSKDYPTISRFKGSVIEFYKETKWGTYALPVNEKGKLDWKNYQKLEGKVIRIQYSVSPDNPIEFILKNYKDAFAKAGYTTLIAIANEELGDNDRPHTWYDRYYAAGGFYDGLNNIKFGRSNLEFPTWKNNRCFIAAKNFNREKEIYAMVYAIEADDYVLITQDVVEVEMAETGFVTVDNLVNDITLKGHSTLYGLHFEVGKATLMPESNPSLQIIANYINANPDKKFFIVGHTDNTGDFESNMTLSEERARNVMAELISKYKVNEKQLKAYGSSSLSPIVSNSTEKGRATNRRVEIVEQ